MKVSQDVGFKPVVITLQTPEELLTLVGALLQSKSTTEEVIYDTYGVRISSQCCDIFSNLDDLAREAAGFIKNN